MKNHFLRKILIRLSHWEYWNSTIVYLPLYPYWLWLSIKSGSIDFLTAANPSIKNGGYIMESKNDVYHLLPNGAYPTIIHFKSNSLNTDIHSLVETNRINYPLIAKPDYGEKGIAVKKISTPKELEEYVAKMPIPFLIQECIPYENEVGIFYWRMPNEDQGHISGIVSKEQVIIVGDGVKTIEELVVSNDRYFLQLEQVRQTYPNQMQDVLPKGASMVLIPYGNHARGSKFTDISHKITDKLTDTINSLCKQIDGFYYGRLDIRYNTWEELEEGKNYSIVELNGSGSEPTHIYDPKHSIVDAWRIILQHWNILYRICKANRKQGVKFNSFISVRKDERKFKNMLKQLNQHTW